MTYTDYFRIMPSLQLAKYLDIFNLEAKQTLQRESFMGKKNKKSTYSKLKVFSADGRNLPPFL